MMTTDSVPVTEKSGSRLLSWSRRLWPVALVLLAVTFLAFSLPPYLTLDPARSRIPPPAAFPAYYPWLVAHIAFASIAMLTASLQIWTGLQRRYPAVHRLTGRVYIFAGVLPAGIAGLVIGSIGAFGPTLRASNVVLSILWLTCTLVGLRMARKRRFEAHRRWMVRSVVLTFSIITNRVWAAVFVAVLSPHLSTTFGGNAMWFGQTIAGLSGWLGWVLPLLITEWWLLDRIATHLASSRFPGANEAA